MTDKKLLKFPCDFPIKVMGHSTDEFEIEVLTIIREEFPELAENAIKINSSREGKYIALTINVIAQSQEQIDATYIKLSKIKHVIMAL